MHTLRKYLLTRCRLVIVKDTKIKDAASFIINKEDDTLGNILRMYWRATFCSYFDHITRQLLRDKEVLFAGYRMPHPLEHSIVVKIQTTPDTTPAKALDNAISDLVAEASLLEERFKVTSVGLW